MKTLNRRPRIALLLSALIAVGTVVALTQYLTRLYGPLTQLSNLQIDVVTALVSFERLFEVLEIGKASCRERV